MNISTGNLHATSVATSDIRQVSSRNNDSKEIKLTDFILNEEERSALSKKVGDLDLDPKDIFDFNNESPEEAMARRIKEGQKQDTGAIIRYQGTVVAMVDYDGSTTTKNSTGPITGNGMSERIASLQALYPGASVDIYPKGQGPTNAEAFEIFNNSKYKDYVEEQYRMAYGSV